MDFSLIIKALPQVLKGTRMTLYLTLAILTLSSLWGFLLALARVYGGRVLSWASDVYIWMLTGVPGLIVLFLCYFGLSDFGIELSPFLAAVLGLTLQHGAYMGEVMRAGLDSVHPGQREAAQSLGLSFPRTLWRIIVPQAARACVAPYITRTTGVVKRTTLASVISVQEATLVAYGIMAKAYRPLEMFTMVAAIFIIMDGALLLVQPFLERKYALRA